MSAPARGPGAGGRRWRFGIIGAGMIAPCHLEAIEGLPNAEVSGIWDGGSGRGRRLAPHLDPRGSDDVERFVERSDIDVVTIATPSGAHLEPALAAARAGKHCIVEKPIEVTLERIDRMIEAHAQAGTALGGIFNTRYTEGARAALQAIRGGRLGRLTFAGAQGPWWRDGDYYASSAWKGTRALDGGGALMNQGIHSIDLLQWLAGEPVVRVHGATAALAHADIEVEDTGVAILELASGALGTLACTTSMYPGHFRTVTLGGTGGTIALADERLLVWRFREPDPGDAALRERLGGAPAEGIGASDPAAGVTADGHRAAFADFLHALEAGRSPPVDGAEARKAVALVLAVYASAARGGAAVRPG